jgi:hypothetical protein
MPKKLTVYTVNENWEYSKAWDGELLRWILHYYQGESAVIVHPHKNCFSSLNPQSVFNTWQLIFETELGFKIFDNQDGYNLAEALWDHERFRGALIPQWDGNIKAKLEKKPPNGPVEPGYWFDMEPSLTRQLQKSTPWQPQKKQLFFSGTFWTEVFCNKGPLIWQSRREALILATQNHREIDVITERLPAPAWQERASKYYCCLCLPRTAWWSTREFDLMGLGIPIMMIEPRVQTLRHPLEPNKHYIAVSNEGILDPENKGLVINPAVGADKILHRWLEVKDDLPKLKAVAEAGRKYYDTYANTERVALEVLEWLKDII